MKTAATDERPIRLFDLAFACRVYAITSQFDNDYVAFRKAIGGRIDFRDTDHLRPLVRWLNAWGCRQFAKQYHPAAMHTITEWAGVWERRLPRHGARLLDIADSDIDVVGEAFSDLSSRPASIRDGKRGGTVVAIGPTGAAKILFAARPDVIAPWDDAIRSSLGYDRDGASFAAFIRLVRKQIGHVASEASRFGITVDELPHRLDRPHSSLPKLIDEYYFITRTRKALRVDASTLSDWYKWSISART